jgi:hypothetical protein
MLISLIASNTLHEDELQVTRIRAQSLLDKLIAKKLYYAYPVDFQRPMVTICRPQWLRGLRRKSAAA